MNRFLLSFLVLALLPGCMGRTSFDVAVFNGSDAPIVAPRAQPRVLTRMVEVGRRQLHCRRHGP